MLLILILLISILKRTYCISGAYAEDWSRWKSLLYSLYDALITEISRLGSRGKYATGSRHVAVKDSLIELTAHICHQVKLQQRCSSTVHVSVHQLISSLCT